VTAIHLCDPKYPENVAGVVRACGAFGIPTLTWSGARVSDRGLHPAATQISRKKARLPIELRRDLYSVCWSADEMGLANAIADGMVPVCVELVDGAESLVDFEHPDDAVYVFGPEDGGVSQEFRRICHRFVQIPGAHCLNLAAAVNVVLYDRCAKVARSVLV
jgi:tRNA(Leu) C34 or U34 (ribose-2'-O)-methylase TrmL